MIDRQNFLWCLLRALTDLRLSNDPHGLGIDSWAEFYSLVNRGLREGYVSAVEFIRLNRLAKNATLNSADLRFPDVRNAGPYMPTSVWFKRHNAGTGSIVVKLGAQVLANEPEQVPAPAPSRNLRLLSLLVTSRFDGARSLPVHTMRPMPPRVCCQGRWDLEGHPYLALRETQATAPSPKVLERYSRLGQANAFRAYPRAVRTGVSQ